MVIFEAREPLRAQSDEVPISRTGGLLGFQFLSFLVSSTRKIAPHWLVAGDLAKDWEVNSGLEDSKVRRCLVPGHTTEQ